MQKVSPDFLQVLKGSHEPVVQVSAWRNGSLLVADLPVTGGQITVTGGQAIRSRVSVMVADLDGALTPTPQSALAPFGSELRIKAGVLIGKTPELVSMGAFPIMGAETDEEWLIHQRPSEPGKDYYTSAGALTVVESVDRAQIVADYRFLSRTQPTQPTVLAEIAWLLKGIVPWAPPAIGDATVPSGLTYDDDRLKAAQDLAGVLDCALVFDGLGQATLKPTAWGASVWDVDGSAGGVRVSMTRALSRDNMYNAVIARGAETTAGLPIQGIATITDGPLAWDGAFGRVPYFTASPLLTTQASVDASAKTTLARLQRQRFQKISVACVSNPAIEVGDIITMKAPKGSIQGEILSATWPLLPGPMSMTVAVDPFLLAEVT